MLPYLSMQSKFQNNDKIYVEINKESIFSTKIGGGITYKNDTLIVDNMPIQKILKSTVLSKNNHFYYFPKSLVKYSGTIFLPNKNITELITLFDLKIDTIRENNFGFIVYRDSTNYIQLDKELDTNYIYKRILIGSNIKKTINQISIDLKTPVEFEPDFYEFKDPIKIYYFKNLSFPQNIALLNSRFNLKLALKKKEIVQTNYIIR